MTSTAPVSTSTIDATVVLQLHDLSKTYMTGFWMNKPIYSLKSCSLIAHKGETFGMLGPNGAGKTTTIKCILGIIKPTTGTGSVLGYELGNQALKHTVGYLPENPYFYDYLTAWEIVELSGRLFNIPTAVLKERIPALFDLVGLPIETARKKQLRTYSKGMLQRTGMAQALVNEPELIFLDEPMSGLDPIGRHQMREIILSLKQQGKTVFFNSHILSDVEAICDRVALLVDGQLVCQGTLDELLGVSEHYQVTGTGGEIESLRSHLTDVYAQGDRWHGTWQGSLSDGVSAVTQAGAQISDIHLQRQSLEDFFMATVRAQGSPLSGSGK